MRRVTAIAVGAILGILVLGLIADLVTTRLIERRAAERVAGATGVETSVELTGWPVTWNLLREGIPRADVVGEPTEDGPRGLEEYRAVLYDVQLDAGALLAGERTVAVSARRALVDVSAAPDVLPFGARRLEVVVTAPEARIGEERSTARGDFARLVGSVEDTEGSQELVTATLTGIDLASRHPGQVVAEATITASEGRLRAVGDAGTGTLPLGVTDLDLRLEEGTARIDRRRARVTAAHVDVDARDVPLPDADAVMRSFVAGLPGFRFHHRHDQRGHPVLLHASQGSFSAILDQEAANALWPYAGRVSLLQDAIRLNAFGLALDVAPSVSPRGVELRPIVPPLLQPIASRLGAVVIDPDLPEGVTLTELAVVPGELHLHGRGERIVLPPARAD